METRKFISKLISTVIFSGIVGLILTIIIHLMIIGLVMIIIKVIMTYFRDFVPY